MGVTIGGMTVKKIFVLALCLMAACSAAMADTLTLPSGLTEIKDRAFYGDTTLTEVVIAEGVTSIGSEAFSGCEKMTSITIPNSVKSIGSKAFAGSSLKEITYPTMAEVATDAFDDIIGIRRKNTEDGTVKLTWEWNDSWTTIADYAFNGDNTVDMAIIPAGVTGIGKEAFEGCSNLTKITYPTAASVASCAFDGFWKATYAEGYTTLSRDADGPSAADVTFFGSYEQDNKTANGAEAIEWLVLDVQDGNALLISKYGLDAKPYNTEDTDVTWETCTLRKWLNTDTTEEKCFLSTAFSSTEQDAILTTTVDNSSSQCYSGWSTSGGNNTTDKIFLLSYTEANKYFEVQYVDGTVVTEYTKSRVLPTAYAVAQGVWTNEHYKVDSSVYGSTGAAGSWWLRSPGSRQHEAAFVHSTGTLANYTVDNIYVSVRSAMWLKLE